MKRIVGFLVAVVAVLVLTSCGGGGGGVPAGTTPVSFTVNWGERSRAIDGPGSAQSIVLRIVGGGITGGDFVFTANRDADPTAHAQNFLTAEEAETGSHTVVVLFYSAVGGTGSQVGYASAQMTVQANGSLSGTIATAGSVFSVTVPPGQIVEVSELKWINFEVKDSEGTILALTPGSAVWNIISGSNCINFEQGMARGLSAGAPVITATVDGVTSPSASVSVTSTQDFGDGTLIQGSQSTGIYVMFQGNKHGIPDWTTLEALFGVNPSYIVVDQGVVDSLPNGAGLPGVRWGNLVSDPTLGIHVAWGGLWGITNVQTLYDLRGTIADGYSPWDHIVAFSTPGIVAALPARKALNSSESSWGLEGSQPDNSQCTKLLIERRFIPRWNPGNDGLMGHAGAWFNNAYWRFGIEHAAPGWATPGWFTSSDAARPPVPGCIIVWGAGGPGGEFGHVGFVKDVNYGNNPPLVLVTERNWDNNGSQRTVWKNMWGTTGHLGYIF